MARHDDIILLRQTLESAQVSIGKLARKSLDDLLADSDLQDILARRLEVIGEAANRVTPDFREAHPEIPWLDIIGLRNRLIHAYDEIDYGVLWDIVAHDIPPLVEHLARILPRPS